MAEIKITMAYNPIFENVEFDTKISSLKNNISNYLNEMKFDLNDFEFNSLIQWHDAPEGRRVYTHENCPTEIRNMITKFIKEEFPE